jgi:hypothetical protein
MAGVTPFSRYLFFGLWMAFIGLIGLYWYSVTLAGSLINDIEQLHQQVTDANATIDELRYELRGPAGCVTLVSGVVRPTARVKNANFHWKCRVVMNKTAIPVFLERYAVSSVVSCCVDYEVSITRLRTY